MGRLLIQNYITLCALQIVRVEDSSFLYLQAGVLHRYVLCSSFGMELGDVPRYTFQRVVEVISYENNSTHVSKIFIFILY